MTVLEATYTYGTREFYTSAGDNIFTIAGRLYGTHNDQVVNSLKVLNQIPDWDSLQPGILIKYLPQTVINRVNEVLV